MRLSPAERRAIDRYRTPEAVQGFLNTLPYNTEPPPGRATLRSFRGVDPASHGALPRGGLTAAVILEQHGYPPLVMSLESIDHLDHVIFVYRRRGRWGSVARSRDLGLHGRRPVFVTPRQLALSYFDPFVDFSGRVKGYAVVDLRALDPYDWRLSDENVWKVERYLLNVPHRKIASSNARVRRLRARYIAFRRAHPGQQPRYYDESRWSALPI